ncbi:MAG: S8 family serine peptidase [Gemmatimonadales bacterium]|nr:S8 family serine peptidase [Candidatus Palauibacter denitrificans]
MHPSIAFRSLRGTTLATVRPLLLAAFLASCSNAPTTPGGLTTTLTATDTVPVNATRPDSSKFVPAPPGEKVPNSYIVTTLDGQPAAVVAERMARATGGTVRHVIGNLPGFALDLAQESMVDSLLVSAEVVRVSEGRKVYSGSVGAGAVPTVQTKVRWNLDTIDSRTFARDSTYRYVENASNVPVYVIDTGINPDHTEFGDRILWGTDVTKEKKFAGRTDTHGHGTLVASVIGGTTTGVAKTVKMIPVRSQVGDKGNDADLAEAMDWVIDHNKGYAVANISLYISGGNDNIDKMIRRMAADGITTVVGAGNHDESACEGSPAREPQAITVSAVDMDGDRALLSTGKRVNYGTCVDVWAPGDSVYAAKAADDDGYVWAQGTSAAAPHVAAVAWLVLGEEGNEASARHISDVITSSATTGYLNVNGPDKFLYAPRSVAWISGPAEVGAAGSYTWRGSAWGGYSITYKWEVSTDDGDTWSAAGTDDRYTRSFNDDEEYTFLLRLTATNDFDEKPSRTWEISVDTGCGRPPCPGASVRRSR